MKRYFSSFLMLIAAAIWGFAFVAQKQAEAVPAFTLVFARSLLGTVFLFFLIMLLDRVLGTGRHLVSKKRPLDFTKVELIGGIACGTVLTAASAFQQIGLSDGTDAGKAAFITALYVLIVPILYRLLGKKSPLTVWISVGVAIIGFYLLCIKSDFTIEASDALVLVCALIFALHIITIDHFSPSCDGVRMSCIQFFTSFILNTVLALIFEWPINMPLVGECLPSLLYLGICSSGIA
jgi:drug/metabolite transporter (DMT)-like permease